MHGVTMLHLIGAPRRCTDGYVYGGLHLAAVFYNGHDTNPFPATYPSTPAIPATGNDNNRFYYFGALYTVKGFTMSASYSLGKNPSNKGRANLGGFMTSSCPVRGKTLVRHEVTRKRWASAALGFWNSRLVRKTPC